MPVFGWTDPDCQLAFLSALGRLVPLCPLYVFSVSEDVVKLLVESSKVKDIDIITGQEELSDEMKDLIFQILNQS